MIGGDLQEQRADILFELAETPVVLDPDTNNPIPFHYIPVAQERRTYGNRAFARAFPTETRHGVPVFGIQNRSSCPVEVTFSWVVHAEDGARPDFTLGGTMIAGPDAVSGCGGRVEDGVQYALAAKDDDEQGFIPLFTAATHQYEITALMLPGSALSPELRQPLPIVEAHQLLVSIAQFHLGSRDHRSFARPEKEASDSEPEDEE